MGATLRKKIIELLEEEELDALELSGILSIREKEVYEHLPHIAKSLAASGRKLVISPYICLVCNYSFGKRDRFDRPGRCPRCKEGHIRMATYSIK
ncbi:MULTISPECIES: transcriptional regulator [Desulfosediminicola]|uniref:transcriptional regulator n=1 Tax=Desulfosediminicola TaxID=2886823 RepID=UPI0010AC7147|nr:transcriptional regulator [Desulfosediminicola ganghwensis]